MILSRFPSENNTHEKARLRPRSWGKRWRAAVAEAVEAALLLSIAFYPQPLSRL